MRLTSNAETMRAQSQSQMNLLPLVILAALMAGRPAVGQENTTPRIVEITVKGNKNVNKESIISASGLKLGQPLTSEAMEEGLRLVRMMGFFGARQPDP